MIDVTDFSNGNHLHGPAEVHNLEIIENKEKKLEIEEKETSKKRAF